HAAASSGHNVHSPIGVVSFKHVNTQVRLVDTRGLHLRPTPVAGVGEGAPHFEVVRRRHLTTGDRDIAADARFSVEGAEIETGIAIVVAVVWRWRRPITTLQ